MAGPSTQSMENFASQGMERHQFMMNTEVMKHFRIMNRASVREIMMQHEKTFKEQVHDLHKLYEVQRQLMDNAKSKGREAYTAIQPPSPGQGKVIFEGSKHGQRSNLWEQLTPDAMGIVKGGASSHSLGIPQKVFSDMAIVKEETSTHNFGSPMKTFSDRTLKLEETTKSVGSPLRKRKIDLEQLPEDDSDDELQNSVDTLNRTTSSLSGNSRELPVKACSDFESLVKPDPGAQVSSGFQPLQPIKHMQAASLFSGDSSSQNNQSNESRGDSSYPSQHGKILPSLSFNVMKTDANPGERLLSFQNTSMLNSGVGSVKNNTTMFLPQADLIDRASQESGRQAHWFFQASEANVVNTPARLPVQQQQTLSPHLALSEHSNSRSHPPTLHLDQMPPNKSPPFESAGGIFGKAFLERNPPAAGAPVGAQKDTSGVLAERLGDSSKWFTKDSVLQGPIVNAVPVARFETGVMPEGGHNVPGVVASVIPVAGSKGLSQERDMSLWPSQNPVLQLPQFQQPTVFQQQIIPPASQALWVQSSSNPQNGLYPQQQVVYGVHMSDPSQVGYRGDSLQRNPGEMTGPCWNTIGLGHYYSSIPSTPQKPPFKKPPKLVLKSDGVGMELKLVSPEEVGEKERVNQKKLVNAMKRESPQVSLKSCENRSGVHRDVVEEDQRLESRTMSEGQMRSSTRQVKESSKMVGVLSEPKLFTTESSLPSLKISQGASNSATCLSVAQQHLGALESCMTGSDIGLGFQVSRSPNESTQQRSLSHLETHPPSPERENIVEQRISSLTSLGATSEKEMLPSTNASADKDMHGQTEESSLIKSDLNAHLGSGTIEDRKEPSHKAFTAEAVANDVVVNSQLESFHISRQVVQLKCQEEGVIVDVSEKRMQDIEEVNGNHLQQSANAESHVKDISEGKASWSVDIMHPSSQPVVQAVSVQSTSTDTPSASRQNERFLNISDNDISHRSSARIPNESGSPISDRECASTPSLATDGPSLATCLSENKSEAVVGTSNEDLQHDSDSDSLAASILLSFAPKAELLKEKQQSKENASELSSTIRKVRPMDQGSNTSRSMEAPSGSRSDTGGGQGRRMQVPGSSRRMDRMDHHRHEHVKVTMKDRQRREEMNRPERPTDEIDVAKSLTIKLPRVASSTLNDEAIPISRSKQLNKLNGVTLSRNPGESIKNPHKGNEVIHTPTGRRSSRGPPMGARTTHESRSRLQQQTQHRVECSPPSPEKGSGMKGGGSNVSRFEGNVKSKAWGELNRTRSSHPRKQFHEMPHRKSQK